jgi:hypothetical protein
VLDHPALTWRRFLLALGHHRRSVTQILRVKTPRGNCGGMRHHVAVWKFCARIGAGLKRMQEYVLDQHSPITSFALPKLDCRKSLGLGHDLETSRIPQKQTAIVCFHADKFVQTK